MDLRVLKVVRSDLVSLLTNQQHQVSDLFIFLMTITSGTQRITRLFIRGDRYVVKDYFCLGEICSNAQNQCHSHFCGQMTLQRLA